MRQEKKKLYTPTQYALHKGVSRRTVYNWIRSKKVETIKLEGGGQVIVEPENNEGK